MNNYKVTIQYDGSRYKGWQRLGNGENTIQGKLENVLFQQFGKEIEIIGCSRTDAGVHSLGQVANFSIEENLSAEEIQDIFDRYLPDDIAVIQVQQVDDRFHARYLAKEKSYLYKIWNHKQSNPFLRKFTTHEKESLDIELMKKAAEYFIGKHDFTAFSTSNSKKKSMVREVNSIDFFEEDGVLVIRVKGNSFLYNMVRRIVGILIEIGKGKLSPESVTEILESKERKKAGVMAEAKGLFLEKITYE